MVATARTRREITCPSLRRTPAIPPSGSGDDPVHRGVDDADVPGGETPAGVVVQRGVAGEVDQVVGQLPEQQRVVDRGRADGQDPDGLVAHLPAVAVRAVHDAVSPVLGETGDLGQHIAQSGGDQQAARLQGAAVGQGDDEAQVALRGRGRGAGGGDLAGHDQAAVPAYLVATLLQQIGRRCAVQPKQSMDALGRCVARGAAVDHDDRTAGAGEHQRAVQARGAATDHHSVDGLTRQLVGRIRGSGYRHGVVPLVHIGPTLSQSPHVYDGSRLLPQTHTILRMLQEADDLDGLVRMRIRALRVARGLSLEDLAARAQLSQSTLSRIENGQRRLALDQLVTLARALDTSLDQLVESATDDVVTSPIIDATHRQLRWPVKADPGITVVRQRLTQFAA